jgi:maltooligosyltrehalose trehalohydrolase
MRELSDSVSLGAICLENSCCQFRVWAPRAHRVEVHLLGPNERLVPLSPRERGYQEGVLEGVPPGSLYRYRLDGDKERPDPTSRFQPDGVHGPSQVVASAFDAPDQPWSGLPLSQYILYELHVGTFTPEGTLDSIIPHLDPLRDLGVTAIELMPLGQFPGGRNWGYDGVGLFAVQNSYGGPEALKRFVQACHAKGLAVVLDVVYNHLGPEGNYLADYGPYFTDQYRTPWGAALNFDGPDSDGVRRFFLENACYWFTQMHVDALRLDAIHALKDFSARPFLEELADATRSWSARLGRPMHLIAESNRNDSRVIRPRELGGYGLDAQWSDDFHHGLHALLTGERTGYYEDFGQLEHLIRAYRWGYTYTGQYSSYRRRRHGNSPAGPPPSQFVVFSQNHDQVGNRLQGDRLSGLVPFDGLKLAAAAVLLSPYVPLLFMGEEYGETALFLFFTSHDDPDLVEAVRRGRRAEFAAFHWQGEPPDPQNEATFLVSKLRQGLRTHSPHAVLLALYKELIRLRKALPALTFASIEPLEVLGFDREQVLFVRRRAGDEEALQVFNLGKVRVEVPLPVPAGVWQKTLDSAEERWLGNGSRLPELLRSEGQITLSVGPLSFAVFVRTNSPPDV